MKSGILITFIQRYIIKLNIFSMCSNAHIKKRRKLPKGVGEPVRQSYKKSQDQKLLHLFLWQMSASLVKTFLSHLGQVYTKVLGKCLDSMWFCKVYFDLWLKFWQMEQVWASTPKSIYLFKSSGLDRPRNNNCLFLPSCLLDRLIWLSIEYAYWLTEKDRGELMKWFNSLETDSNWSIK